MSTPQKPTCTGLRIRAPADALVVFHAVALGILPLVERRLAVDERRFIHSGCVFVWQERIQSAEGPAVGIERWTDGRRWGPSRVRDEFLYYHEKLPEFDADEEVASLILGSRLVKQTYSIFVETPIRRKWHLVAYFTQANLDSLHTVDDVPQLLEIRELIPAGKYITSRSAHTKPRTKADADADADADPDPDPDPDAEADPDPDEADAELTSSSASSTQHGDENASAHDGAGPGAGGATVLAAGPARVTLPALKPPPWRDPSWVLSPRGAHAQPLLPDRHGAQAQRRERERGRAMPPLVYMMTSPYPPRHPADNDLLKMFDIGMV